MVNFLEHPLLARGFRPFFFLGALYSVFNLAIWGGLLAGGIEFRTAMIAHVSWHAHEMIYGYSLAIIAGFLLTAVANWTSSDPAKKWRLLGLCLLWVMGRVTMLLDFGFPAWLNILLEVAFIPFLTLTLAIPLLRSWNKRNFIFLCLLGILWGCDLWFMLVQDHLPLLIALIVILIMISLVGGRIIPAFTVAALRRRNIKAFQTPQTFMDSLALLSLLGVGLCLGFSRIDEILAATALISAVIHLLRMRHYHTSSIWHDPLLWVLQLGFVWLIVGLLLLATAGLDMIPLSTALHAFTTGCIGTMTLGMMVRVTLGHTGRDLIASRLTVLSFILMQVAALVRVFAPILVPDHTSAWVIVSACMWSLTFFLYLLSYAPVLFRSRPDGRPA